MYRVGPVHIFCLIHLTNVSVRDDFLPRWEFRHRTCRNRPSTLTSRFTCSKSQQSKKPLLEEKSRKPEPGAHLNNLCEHPFLFRPPAVLGTSTCGWSWAGTQAQDTLCTAQRRLNRRGKVRRRTSSGTTTLRAILRRNAVLARDAFKLSV